MTSLRRAAAQAVPLSLVAVALATTAFADSSIGLSHDGNGRSITVEAEAAEAWILSHGDGGSLAAELTETEDVGILHLGGSSDAELILDGVSRTVVAVGHCPDDAAPAPVVRHDTEHDLMIARCVY